MTDNNSGQGCEGCPFRKYGMKGDADNSYSCELTAGPDADHRGWGYNDCDFSGKDYNECSRLQADLRKRAQEKNLSGKQ